MPNESIKAVAVLQTFGAWAFMAVVVRALLSAFDGEPLIRKVAAGFGGFLIGLLVGGIALEIESLVDYQLAVGILSSLFGYDILQWVLKNPAKAIEEFTGYLPWTKNPTRGKSDE